VTLYEVVRPPRNAIFTPGSYLFFDHGVIAHMHRLGFEAAGEWLATGPRVDRLGQEDSAEVAQVPA
jgi:hypothetical protein